MVLASLFTNGSCIFNGGGCMSSVDGVQGLMAPTYECVKKEMVVAWGFLQNVTVRIDSGSHIIKSPELSLLQLCLLFSNRSCVVGV
jgi:hypothetical protein